MNDHCIDDYVYVHMGIASTLNETSAAETEHIDVQNWDLYYHDLIAIYQEIQEIGKLDYTNKLSTIEHPW